MGVTRTSLFLLMVQWAGLVLGQREAELAKHQEIAALGRHFTLGALYDIREERVLPLSLWNQETIEKKKLVTPQPHQDFKIKAANSFYQKADFMDIEGNVQMSFLGGMLKVAGSAKYLKSKKSTGKYASVSAVWKSTKMVESLTQELFSNIEYENNLQLEEATHVVTKILYGADAYFQFERTLGKIEERSDIEGKLSASLAGIFSLEGNVKVEEEEIKRKSQITVSFFGDFSGIRPPTTLNESIDVVTKLVDAEDVVPMKVTLTPLHLLDDQITTLLREVNQNTVRRAAELRSHLESVIEQLEDELVDNTVDFFPSLRENLELVKRRFQRIEDDFEYDLRNLLPEIRNNTVSESELILALNKIENGVYHSSFFDDWLKTRKRFANGLAKKFSDQTEFTVMEKVDDKLVETNLVTVLPTEDAFYDFESDNFDRLSYYLLVGSLKGPDETYYIDALTKNDTSIIENAPTDRSTWVYKYRRPLQKVLREFKKLNLLEDYLLTDFETLSNTTALKKKNGQKAPDYDYDDDLELPEMLGIPRRAIRIEMPGESNEVRIVTYFEGVEIEILPVDSIRYENENDHLQYTKQFTKEYTVFGYEISLRASNKRTPTYSINILSKKTLTAGQKYFFNIRVVLEGGVRGPWNSKDYTFTRPVPPEPVDGVWSPWTPSSSCSVTCGSGQRTVKRECSRPAPSNGGKKCLGEAEKQETCTTSPCKVNCVVGQWGGWSSCSERCGTGERSRTRKVVKQPQHGGAKCPGIRDNSSCNTQKCPVDCQVGPWASCSKTCGGGTRKRKATRNPQYGGKACPTLSESCNTQTCTESSTPFNRKDWLDKVC